MRTFQRRDGFTLIELLTVIGIIAVLAAILFPVFGQARGKARQARCLSNMQQIGVAIESYVQDHGGFLPTWCITNPEISPWNPPSGNENQPVDGVTTWDMSIMTYLKQDALLVCPDNPNDNSQTARSYAIAQYTQRPQQVDSTWIALGGYKDDFPIPSETVLLFEKGNNPPGAWGDALGQNVYQYHGSTAPDPDGQNVGDFRMWHQGGKNFLYVDYHVKWSKATSGPFTNKPTDTDSPGTCENWGKPADGGDWPVP